MNKSEILAGDLRRRQSNRASFAVVCRVAWLRRLAFTLAIALAVPFAGSQAADGQRLIQITGAEHTSSVLVPIGKSQDVRTGTNFVDISVGDPEIADVNPLTDHTLSILGKKIGTTRVSVYSAGKTLIGIFDVEVTYDITRLTNELKRRFPGSRIAASSVNGRIMLTGDASDAVTLDGAVTIARQFGPEIINAVSVAQPQQVLLEVRFVEITRNASRELGLQWNRFGGSSITNIGNGTNNLPVRASTIGSETSAGVLSGAAPFGFMIARFVAGGASTDMMINALEEQGVARSLAEPNLVALSGDTASFLAGGEYPIPVAGTLGQVTVDYKKYGVGLAFTPTVLSAGVINLKIVPEVSQIDASHTVSVANGISVPALIVRRAATTVELRDGQSFAIGGLLQNNTQTQVQQLPWLGSMPVLGALFASRSYQKNETDLVIIVTPRLVRPARPGDVLKTPADATTPPNDADFFVAGKNEIPKSPQPATPGQALAAAAISRPMTGHVLDLPQRGSNVVIR